VNDGAKIGFELSLALLPAEAVRRPVEILQDLCDNVFAVLSAVKSVRPAVAAEDAGRVDQEHFIKPGPVYVLEAIHRLSLSLVASFHVGRCFHYLLSIRTAGPGLPQNSFTFGGNVGALIRKINRGCCRNPARTTPLTAIVASVHF
jgi:hypothetical protein